MAAESSFDPDSFSKARRNTMERIGRKAEHEHLADAAAWLRDASLPEIERMVAASVEMIDGSPDPMHRATHRLALLGVAYVEAVVNGERKRG